MEELANVSIIIPVHELDELSKELLGNSITSVLEQKLKAKELIIVVPKGSDVIDHIKTIDFGAYKDSVVIAENDGKTDFQSQINYAVSIAKCDWISVLEMDDEFSSIWIRNANKYISAYPDVEMFMPIILDVERKVIDGNPEFSFMGFTNEAVWAQSFSDVLGVLDLNALLAYPSFNIDGMVIKKSTFIDNGGFKSNIKLTFTYEFLLRMTFKDVKVMVIPKYGYKHLNSREGSLFVDYKNTLDPTEAKWWLSVAKKEYFFDKDREITYLENNN